MDRIPFQFKQFKINDNKSAMKLGTDSVILGAWVDFSHAKTILDIGTGCGILALIAAQNSTAKIDAIDIDKGSIDNARENFMNSPWKKQLQAINISLGDFIKNPLHHTYDIIICNPPYFIDSQKSPNKNTNLAKHNISFNYADVAVSGYQLLGNKGKMYLIIPSINRKILENVLLVNGLYVNKTLEIFPNPYKVSNRACLEISKEKIRYTYDKIMIRNKESQYTKEYKNLTQDYYTIF